MELGSLPTDEAYLLPLMSKTSQTYYIWSSSTSRNSV